MSLDIREERLVGVEFFLRIQGDIEGQALFSLEFCTALWLVGVGWNGGWGEDNEDGEEDEEGEGEDGNGEDDEVSG